METDSISRVDSPFEATVIDKTEGRHESYLINKTANLDVKELMRVSRPDHHKLVNRKIVQQINTVNIDDMSMEQIMRELMLLLGRLESEYSQVAKDHRTLISDVSSMAAKQLEKSFNTYGVLITQILSGATNIGGGVGPIGIFDQIGKLSQPGVGGNVAVIKAILPRVGALANALQTKYTDNPQAFSTQLQLFSQGVGVPATYFQQDSQKDQSKWTAAKQAADSMVQSGSQEEQQIKQRSQEFLGCIRQIHDQLSQLVSTMHR